MTREIIEGVLYRRSENYTPLRKTVSDEMRKSMAFLTGFKKRIDEHETPIIRSRSLDSEKYIS